MWTYNFNIEKNRIEQINIHGSSVMEYALIDKNTCGSMFMVDWFLKINGQSYCMCRECYSIVGCCWKV